jgi:hypothetical protein
MATAWNGGDPSEVVDSEDYELGIAYRADGDLTMTHARIYTPAGEETISPRRFRLWSSAGGAVYAETLPDDLATGWSLHELTTPQEITSGTTFVVSFNTGGNYGALSGALDNDVVSADGLVTALAASNAPGGANGRFNETPGSFPNAGTGGHAFYGVDFQYTAGIGGNTAPRITALTAEADGAAATVTATVADDETLTGATLRFKWGDGSSDTLVSYPTVSAQHTYSASGLYAVLVTLTDASGAADNEAVVAEVHVPDADVVPLDFPAIRDALASHAQATGRFDAVTKHEPFSKPNGVHAAIWLDSLTPLPLASGLATVTVRLAFLCRIYLGAENQPYDDVDAKGLAAADRLMAAWAGDFTLNGRVRNVDIKGTHGVPLSAQAGYQRIGDKTFRVLTLTVPVIVNDVWAEVA